MLLSQVLKLQVFLKHTEAATRDVLLKLQVFLKHTEAATRCVLWKKVFLEISQNSQENTFIKACNFIKKTVSGTGVSLLILWNF